MKLLKPEIDASMINDAGQLLVNILDFKQKVEQQKHDQPSAGANDQESRVGDKTSQVTDKQMGQSSNKRKKITLKQKECRCLLAQMKSAENTKQSQFQVAELFSPPRFSLEVEKHGGKGLAFDIKQGWDLLNPKTQEQVDRLLDKACPELFSSVSHLHSLWGMGKTWISTTVRHWREPSWSGEIGRASDFVWSKFISKLSGVVHSC